MSKHTTTGSPNLNEAVNPKRRAKKATGLKGRQWVKFRKAQQRARKAAAK